MPADVIICNLALAHLGDTATIASIYPPDGSIQAEHCARFYPIARDSMLEMHPWSFCTRRTVLASYPQNWTMWTYAYQVPANALNVFAVMAPDATDDYSESFAEADPTNPSIFPQGYTPLPGAALYVPQAYSIETNPDGQPVLFTNVQNAICRYSLKITDATLFPPLFTQALSWLLASMLAGPIIKGDAGAAMADRCMQTFIKVEQQAEYSDASQRDIKVWHLVPWVAGR